MKKHSTHNLAFTLIELLVVISIIALLSSIIVATVSSAREKGIIAKAKGEMALLRNEVEIYRATSGTYVGAEDHVRNNTGILASLETVSGNTIEMYESTDAWSGEIDFSIISDGMFLCADVTGYSGYSAGDLESNATCSRVTDPSELAGGGGGVVASADYQKCALFKDNGWTTMSGEYTTYDVAGAIIASVTGVHKDTVAGIATAHCASLCTSGHYIDQSVRPTNTSGSANVYCAGPKTSPYMVCGIESNVYGVWYYTRYGGLIPNAIISGYMALSSSTSSASNQNELISNCQAQCSSGTYLKSGGLYYCI